MCVDVDLGERERPPVKRGGVDHRPPLPRRQDVDGLGFSAGVAVVVVPERRDEELGGPVMQKGPLAKGAINFGGGGAPTGQATAFWSRDAMKAALDNQPDDEEEEAFRPKVGGGSATAF